MAEQYMTDALWQGYYDELDPVKRVRIYAENIGAEAPDRKRSAIVSMRRLEPVTEADMLRRDLFLHRHTGPKGQEMDRIMAAIMELMHLGRDQSRMAIKEVRSILQGLGFDLVQDKGDAAESMLYQEIYNGAQRYLSCCTGGDYARAFFGLMAASKARQNDKTTEDIWHATRGIERLIGRSITEQELARLHLYEDAVITAFYQYDEDASDWFADYEKRH